jgi:hypothetical protein
MQPTSWSGCCLQSQGRSRPRMLCCWHCACSLAGIHFLLLPLHLVKRSCHTSTYLSFSASLGIPSNSILNERVYVCQGGESCGHPQGGGHPSAGDTTGLRAGQRAD